MFNKVLLVVLSLAAASWLRSAEAISIVRVVSEPVPCIAGSGESCNVRATCPSGSTVIGGGASGTEAIIESSYPDTEASWTVTFWGAVHEFGDAAAATVSAYAVCTYDVVDAYTTVQTDVISCPAGDGSCEAIAYCPDGTVVLGGGGIGDGTELESTEPAPAPDQGWRISWYPAVEQQGNDAIGSAQGIAICGTAPEGYEIRRGLESRCLVDGRAARRRSNARPVSR